MTPAPWESPRTIPVRLENGLVIWHTPDEYRRFFDGLDPDGSKAHRSHPLEMERDP